MSRLRWKELHEYAACPPLFRTLLTDWLSFFAGRSGVYLPAVRQIAEMTADLKKKEIRIMDLCSGSGFYYFPLLGHLRQIRAGDVFSVLLSDKNPPLHWTSPHPEEAIRYYPGPLTAENAIKNEKPDLLTMFSALHHFDPEELREMLQSFADSKQDFAFFDYSQRRFFAEIIPFLCVFPIAWGVTPFLTPRTFLRFLFTYPIPVVPLLLLIDGTLSRMRAYRCDELKEIIQNIKMPEDYKISVSRESVFHGHLYVTALCGKRKSE